MGFRDKNCEYEQKCNNRQSNLSKSTSNRGHYGPRVNQYVSKSSRYVSRNSRYDSKNSHLNGNKFKNGKQWNGITEKEISQNNNEYVKRGQRSKRRKRGNNSTYSQVLQQKYSK